MTADPESPRRRPASASTAPPKEKAADRQRPPAKRAAAPRSSPPDESAAPAPLASSAQTSETAPHGEADAPPRRRSTRETKRRDAAPPHAPPFLGPVTPAEAKVLDAKYEALKKAPTHLSRLAALDDAELRALAASLGVAAAETAPRAALLSATLEAQIRADGLAFGEGVLEVLPEGYGFLRQASRSYLAGPDDVYVAPSQIRRFRLRPGSRILGHLRPPKPSEKFFALLRVESVDGDPPERAAARPAFDDLPPAHPVRRLRLETEGGEIVGRLLDLFAPLGRGQRGIVAAPPRSGKTLLLSAVADALAKNHPEVELLMLLVDERPEEAAELRRRVRGEVVASTFDEDSPRHLQIAELTLQRAKRLTEAGRDVVILLDSLTRLARAFNADAPRSGRVLSGGVEAAALQRPKRFFGAARAVDGGGSLTVLATALIETGSRMDEVIYEEFKGTGNLEIVLDRGLAEKRLFPAVDLRLTGTRREELLLTPEELRRTKALRAVCAAMEPEQALGLLLGEMKRTPSNAALLAALRG
jgi:transcription termination factor Rho